ACYTVRDRSHPQPRCVRFRAGVMLLRRNPWFSDCAQAFLPRPVIRERVGVRVRAGNSQLTTSQLTKHARLESLEPRRLMALDSSVWSPIGPAPIASGQTPGGLSVSGRIYSFAE